MFKSLALSICFCLLAVSAYAAERTFNEFSIDLPSGWDLVNDPIEAPGAILYMIGTEDYGLVIGFAATNGESVADLAQQTLENMKAQGATLDLVSQTDHRAAFAGSQQGIDIQAFITADPAAKTMATLVLSGSISDLEAVAKTIKTANPNLSFY